MDDKADVWQGTLASVEPLHGYEIARHIEHATILSRFLSSTDDPA